jgi:hypothetical protein
MKGGSTAVLSCCSTGPPPALIFSAPLPSFSSPAARPSHLAVRLGGELDPGLLGLNVGHESLVVVDLSVDRHHQGLVLVEQGLVTRGRVDDGKALVGQEVVSELMQSGPAASMAQRKREWGSAWRGGCACRGTAAGEPCAEREPVTEDPRAATACQGCMGTFGLVCRAFRLLSRWCHADDAGSDRRWGRTRGSRGSCLDVCELWVQREGCSQGDLAAEPRTSGGVQTGVLAIGIWRHQTSSLGLDDASRAPQLPRMCPRGSR